MPSYGSQSVLYGSQGEVDAESQRSFTRLQNEPVKSMAFATKRGGGEEAEERDIEMVGTETERVIRVRNEINQGWVDVK